MIEEVGHDRCVREEVESEEGGGEDSREMHCAGRGRDGGDLGAG
jgi:hypothetical protein